MRVACPALRKDSQPEQDPTLAVSIQDSPLSPGCLLKLLGSGVRFQGWTRSPLVPPSRIVLPMQSGTVTKECGGVVYERKRDGKLASNWILIWTEPKSPVLVVMEESPASVSVEKGELGVSSITIRFSKGGSEVIVMRPLLEKGSLKAGVVPQSLTRTCEFWNKVLRLYPVEFVEISRVKDNKRELLISYEYLRLRGGGTCPSTYELRTQA